SSTQLGPCVEEVSLTLGSSESRTLLQSFLVTFTTRLPNMRRLGIGSHLFGPSLNMSHPMFSMAASGFWSITELFLHSARFSTINDLGFFLCALPSLSVLHIGGLDFPDHRQYNPVLFQKSKARLSLVSLTIQQPFVGVLADLIMDVVSFPEHAVANFTIMEPSREQLDRINDIFDLSPSLNSLGSDLTLCPRDYNQPEVPHILNMIKSSSLR
ncbi:hypothetical protein B0H21DRAFT_764985, partial [Amylocystis lapponica]